MEELNNRLIHTSPHNWDNQARMIRFEFKGKNFLSVFELLKNTKFTENIYKFPNHLLKKNLRSDTNHVNVKVLKGGESTLLKGSTKSCNDKQKTSFSECHNISKLGS